jgi:PAS domain S-box-containing protein
MIGANMDVTERHKAEQALKESEEKYRLIVENAKEAIFLFQNKKIRLANPAGREILGYSEKDLFSGSFLDPIVSEDREMVRRYHFRRLEGKEAPSRYSFRVRNAQGEMRWIEIDPVKVTWEGEPAILTFMTDITDRKAAEDRLRESEERFREFASLLPQFVYEIDLTGKLTFVNQAALNAAGITPEDLAKGVIVTNLFIPEDRGRAAESVQRLLSGKRLEGRELTLMGKNGARLPLMTYSSPIEKNNKIVGFRGIAVDVSPLKEAESRIRASLEEKELLLREIHHRVKNNLAIVNSLLRLQSRYAKDDGHRQMFLEAQQRIKSMAFAHEMLYNSDNLAAVDAREYVDKLVDHLVESVGLSRRRIIFQKHVGDLTLGLDTAIPMGFVLTELVTNALKHAFPGGSKGTVEVRLSEVGDNTLELSVNDDGVGLPETTDLLKPRSFGLKLVKIFSEQLEGKISITSTQGTRLRLTFPNK